jgi:hypothetical protein
MDLFEMVSPDFKKRSKRQNSTCDLQASCKKVMHVVAIVHAHMPLDNFSKDQ